MQHAGVQRGQAPDQKPLRTVVAPSLAQRVVVGALWTVLTGVGARVVGLAGTVLLTYFLNPDEYGEISLAAVVIMTANTVSNCGLSQYLVSKPQAGRQAAFHATFYFMAFGIVALGVALVVGGPLGGMIRAPGIVRFLPGLALATLLDRVATIQDRIQLREMRFRSVGIQRSIGELVFTGVAVGLAWLGPGTAYGGGNAVVLASIARSAVRLVTLSATTDRREWLSPCRLTLENTRDLLGFGAPMAVASLAGFGSRRWDNLIYAEQFGQAQAGIYNLAYNLADIPATQVADTLGDVLVPSFAAIEAPDRLRAAVVVSLRQMTLVVSPLAIGLGAVAPTLVATFLDPRWADVAPALAILSVLSLVRPVAWIGSAYLQVKNRPLPIMVIELVKTVGLLVLMYLAGRYGGAIAGPGMGAWSRGETWACVSIGVSFGAGSLAYMFIFKRIEGVSLTSQVGSLLPPVLACLPMAAVILAVQGPLARTTLPPGARLALEVITGILVFVPSAFVIAPRASREFVELVTSALRRRRSRGTEALPASVTT